MIETSVLKSEGVSSKKHHLEQSLFSFVSSANENCLCIFPMSVSVKLESPSSFVERISYSMIQFKPVDSVVPDASVELVSPPRKRLKTSESNDETNQELEDVMLKVQTLSDLILATLDNDLI